MLGFDAWHCDVPVGCQDCFATSVPQDIAICVKQGRVSMLSTSSTNAHSRPVRVHVNAAVLCGLELACLYCWKGSGFVGMLIPLEGLLMIGLCLFAGRRPVNNRLQVKKRNLEP